MDTREKKQKEPETHKHYRNFNVEVVNNGFIVTIGCQKLVFKNLYEIADALKEYWDDPSETEARYMKKSIKYNEGTAVGTAYTTAASVMNSGSNSILGNINERG